MQCDDLFTVLAEYVDGVLDPQTAVRIRHHLEECPICELVVDNIRKTISVFSTHPAVEMPAAFQEHLGGLLHDRFRAKFSSCDGGAGSCTAGI
jgi:anti-sigma factor RsiW